MMVLEISHISVYHSFFFENIKWIVSRSVVNHNLIFKFIFIFIVIRDFVEAKFLPMCIFLIIFSFLVDETYFNYLDSFC